MTGCPDNCNQAALVACDKTSMAVAEAIPDQRLLSFGSQLETLSLASIFQTLDRRTPTRREIIGGRPSNVRSSNKTRLHTVAARILNHTCSSRSFQNFTAGPSTPRLFSFATLLRNF